MKTSTLNDDEAHNGAAQHSKQYNMPPKPTRTLVVDNGSYTIKAGFAAENAVPEDCLQVPNCLARARDKRVLVGQQLDSCRDFGSMSFRRPVEKVCLPSAMIHGSFPANYLYQRAIWSTGRQRRKYGTGPF